MDQERARLQADLLGLVDCEVHCSEPFLQIYASDASIYQILPLGIVRPRNTADVVAVVQYAAEHQIPIHARGAGSGLAGESIGTGIVMDFSHSMRRVIEVVEDTVRLQPGVVLAQLNRDLAARDLFFGPDPSTRSVTTMGSVVAIDASGSHWPQYGSARSRVLELELVTADGEVHRLSEHDLAASRHSDTTTNQLVSRVGALVERDHEKIQKNRREVYIDHCGYQLHDVLNEGQLNMARLVSGSEGTLGLITEATLKLDKPPPHRGLALLFFDRLESAARAATEVMTMEVSTCDLMDRRLLTIARETDFRYERLIPRDAEAMLLVEVAGLDVGDVRKRLDTIVTRMRRKKRGAFEARATMEPEQRDLFWRIARRIVPMLYRLKGAVRPLPFVEDVAIPPNDLPKFLMNLQDLLKRHKVTASVFAHAGQGQLHIRPFFDLGSVDDQHRMQSLAESIYELTLEYGGTISGEHGLGLSRTWFAHRQYGEMSEVYRSIKRFFDPQNLLNPGKVVAEYPQPLIKNLRPVKRAGANVGSGDSADRAERRDELNELTNAGGAPSANASDSPAGESAGAAATDPADLGTNLGSENLGTADVDESNDDLPAERELFPLLMAWDQDEALLAARDCNGCGRCRTSAPIERMCPIFRFAPREEASPRAKANLMRAVLTGQLPPTSLATDEMREIADLCVNCHQCRLECPAGVDIPKLMTEFKGQHVAQNGLRMSDWMATRLDLLCSLASRVAPFANWAMANRRMRWLIEKLTGLAQGRKVPRLSSRSFIRWAHRKRLTRPSRQTDRKVVLFLDVYPNWFDSQLCEAIVRILKHNGFDVHVPPTQRPSGITSINVGAVEHAQKLASHNIRLLAESVRQGYSVVTPEPAAALCLKHEYLQLIDDEDARLVAENSSEVCQFLWDLHRAGKLALDLRPLHYHVGYHLPCHTRAVTNDSPGERLLELIPSLNVERIEKGCSGMAGAFGMKRANYRSSLRAGWGLISSIREPRFQAGSTQCMSCKVQMEQGTSKPTIHPLKLLALSYGLMPELDTLMSERSEELTIT
jgi:FAD/FMN-containing dehydrogenase/Fe-S oxidoreductase